LTGQEFGAEGNSAELARMPRRQLKMHGSLIFDALGAEAFVIFYTLLQAKITEGERLPPCVRQQKWKKAHAVKI